MRILTGIQPSGALHLGNYFGAMLPAIQLQDQGEAFYFIADYHSMTSLTDAAARRRYTFDVALDFLACGLDPARCVFWRQSDTPEHTELAWILSTVTPMGLLERCHSFKDKVAKLGDGEIGSVNHGLFAYPVLMAADILLYDSNVVPVGKDQKQHLEVTRDIAGKFNQLYGQTFVIPEPRIRGEGTAVPGLAENLDGVAVALAHLLAVEARDCCAFLADARLGDDEGLAVKLVELAGDVARDFEMLLLVLADRDDVRVVKQNVRGH